ncbi:cysteine desulfurase sulfur acceptor subunit CsdE [Candidatus Erwinia haradaeae]|nr:cysteine desulfurase sulfur acceptor subunit CsdE [Candidatus Erwinia haradaeae]
MFFTTIHPFGTMITANLLLEKFSQCQCWEERYRCLILLGQKLPALHDALKNNESELMGCENKVWLGYQRYKNNKLHFYGDSESRIVRGLLAVLLTTIEGKHPRELYGKDLLTLFFRLGLKENLSAGRTTGLYLLSDKVLQIAKNALHKCDVVVDT